MKMKSHGRKRVGEWKFFLKKEFGGTHAGLTTPVLPRPERTGRKADVCSVCVCVCVCVCIAQSCLTL